MPSFDSKKPALRKRNQLPEQKSHVTERRYGKTIDIIKNFFERASREGRNEKNNSYFTYTAPDCGSWMFGKGSRDFRRRHYNPQNLRRFHKPGNRGTGTYRKPYYSHLHDIRQERKLPENL
ncbi:hypothetical protein FTO70_02610 [Methanosarcina sp. KYL-1]|nr:hypothetical protein [Methanosarcina sp. KYL-1]